MANRDIAGLLTGIPSGGIDPLGSMSARERIQQRALRNQQRMGSALGGMFSGGQPTGQEQLIKAMGEDIQGFDTKTTDEQKKLVTLLQMSGRTGLAAQLASRLKDNTATKQQAGLKEGLLKIARSQENQEMIDFIEAGGSLQTASTKLLGDKTTTTGVSTLTETEKEEYEDYFDIISDEELEKAGVSTGIFAKLTGDKGAKSRLMYQAEQIYTNAVKQKRPLTRQQALLEAMNITSSGSSVVPTTDGATPRGQQKDSFVGTPIKG
jgi:hypothetical protein